MTLFLSTSIAIMVFWIFLDVSKERMEEKNRFNSSKGLSYIEVCRNLLKKACRFNNIEELESLVWLFQSALVFLAFIVSVIAWILYLPSSALVVTLLSLMLAMILPKFIMKSFKDYKERTLSDELSIASFLLTIRARSDESVTHVLSDVVDSLPNQKDSQLSPLLSMGLFSYKLDQHFFEAMEKINSAAPYSSVQGMTEAMSSWYSDAEGGTLYLSILAKEQETIYQLQQSMKSGFYTVGVAVAIVSVLLLTTIVFVLLL